MENAGNIAQVSGAVDTIQESLTGFAQKSWVESQLGEVNDEIDSLTAAVDELSGSITGYATHAELESGLAGKLDRAASAEFYPMNDNPAGYLTAHQDLSNYATVSAVNEAIDDLTEEIDGQLESIDDAIDMNTADIAAISYDAESLSILGNIEIEGHIKNQYSMDEHDGVLRVVTSTSRIGSYLLGISKDNVNLYCIDLANWGILATVEAFAPDGEEAESVRFDGDYAYVCTAEVVTLTDPVYFFDLSDLNNITWKDTGTIDGYSSSLVNFGNGNLIGIGFGDERQLKIEAYRETETGVESICSYEQYASFSTDYKSYYIDRENQLIGIGLYFWDTQEYNGYWYVLLHFDGNAFHELAMVPMRGNVLEHEMRGVVIDGWLYVFANEFHIQKVW
jgi:uncharacterized secreted protein with C-terminal beta-propeller domain